MTQGVEEMSLEIRVKQQHEEIKTLIEENKKLAKANDNHKEKIERYEKALKKIRLLPWKDSMDAQQIAFEVLKL
jgi:alpha-ketoglutarate-dependent taurine dioxygenase